MSAYFRNIGIAISTLWDGMRLTWKHFVNKKELNATLQYPHEKWPIPERHIGFPEASYNIIRSRLHVDIDNCISCRRCERACPIHCIKIDAVKAPKDHELGQTSNGTDKKLLVARFDIDMAECCWCNLCTYDCPEECIYMVGGPNGKKHPIDYEFSKRDRNDLVFQFATASDEQVAEISAAAGVADPRAARKQRRENYYLPDGGQAEAVDVKAADKADKPAVDKPKVKAKPAEPKMDMSALSVIEDRVVRGLAKKTAMGAVRAGKQPVEVAEAVKAALSEAGKLTAALETIIGQLAQATITQPEAAATEKPVAETKAAKDTPEGEIDLSVLDGITDRMARGKAKAILNRAKRQGGPVAAAVDEIRTTLSGLGKLNSEIEEILAKLEG